MSEKKWWIVIPNWDRFQHYSNRTPTWIKLYTELAHNDDWRDLTWHQRGVLCGIWLEYAAARGQLGASTTSLTRRLGGRVTMQTLKALSDAGFIDIVASKPLALRYQDASPSALAREEQKRESPKLDLSSAKSTTTRGAPAPDLEGRAGAHLQAVEDQRETDEEYDARAIGLEEFLAKVEAGELPFMAEEEQSA